MNKWIKKKKIASVKRNGFSNSNNNSKILLILIKIDKSWWYIKYINLYWIFREVIFYFLFLPLTELAYKWMNKFRLVYLRSELLHIWNKYKNKISTKNKIKW